MSEMVEQFRAYRAKMNEKILAADNKVIKRIYNLDTNTYMDGALSSKVNHVRFRVCGNVRRHGRF